ncbi:hypothetical protein PIB30_046830 [Stylosanthes scabra]|uniref:Uncharacterized protein n=1 Tax=Stylosanthes scabra TaxID=79078 RepID=A0ABU6UFD2_9FABA|nr:hypothetical protein [Stylosanthes scabra]
MEFIALSRSHTLSPPLPKPPIRRRRHWVLLRHVLRHRSAALLPQYSDFAGAACFLCLHRRLDSAIEGSMFWVGRKSCWCLTVSLKDS